MDNLRGGLAGLNVGNGDAVGIIANNRVEWAVAAFASYGLGARFVPMYEAELIHVWEYIIRDSSIKVLFVSKPEIYEKVKGLEADIPTLEKILLIEGDGEGTMAGLEETVQAHPIPAIHPDPDELIRTQGIKDLISNKIVTFLKGKYGGYEIPRKFIYLSENFTLENGMLTQTMKVKRRVVLEKYKEEIEAQYK